MSNAAARERLRSVPNREFALMAFCRLDGGNRLMCPAIPTAVADVQNPDGIRLHREKNAIEMRLAAIHQLPHFKRKFFALRRDCAPGREIA